MTLLETLRALAPVVTPGARAIIAALPKDEV